MMAVFSEVKCGNCDRRYSSIHSRCPYCHAKKGKLGKHANDNDNTLGKVIIGFLIILVLIVAAVVVIVTSGKDKAAETDETKPNTAADESITQVDSAAVEESIKQNVQGKDDGKNTEKDDKKDTENKIQENDTENKPEEKKTDKVEEIDIYLADGSTKTEDFTIFVGDYYQPVYDVYPVLEGHPLKFSSDNPDVFMVDDDGGVTGTGYGDATLTVTCDGVTATCTVRIRYYEDYSENSGEDTYEDYEDYEDYESYEDYE